MCLSIIIHLKKRKKKRVRFRECSHLMSPTNSMIMMKFGGYSDLDLCWYRQQGTNIFRQPMTVVEII